MYNNPSETIKMPTIDLCNFYRQCHMDTGSVFNYFQMNAKANMISNNPKMGEGKIIIICSKSILNLDNKYITASKS